MHTMSHARYPSDPCQQDRRTPRAGVSLPCEVRQGSRPWQSVILDDLSPTGFRVAYLSHPDLTKPLSIRIKGMQLLTATLCWTRGQATGCEFNAPLHIAVFEHLVRQSGAGMRF